MAIDTKDLITTAQDQFFTAFESAQDVVLEGVKLCSGAVKAVVPTDLIKSVPGFESLPSPAEYVALRFDSEKLLAHQRAFIEAILAETSTTTTAASATPSSSPMSSVSSAETKPTAAAVK